MHVESFIDGAFFGAGALAIGLGLAWWDKGAILLGALLLVLSLLFHLATIRRDAERRFAEEKP